MISSITIPQGTGSFKNQIEIKIDDGYSVFIGPNNIGKSALLQRIFLFFYQNSNIGNEGVCYIPKSRDFVAQSTNTNNKLANWNKSLFQTIANSQNFVLPHGDAPTYNIASLFPCLVNAHSTGEQLRKVQEIFEKLNLGKYRSAGAGLHYLNDVEITQNGSGVRSLLPIIGALSCPTVKIIIIDEPESSLEIGKQKELKRLLLEACLNDGKTIILATHSSTFLNFDESGKNFILNKDEATGETGIRSILDTDELAIEIVKMLGMSPSDFLLPNNYMLVEGLSDQIIVDKVMQLTDAPGSAKVRVLSCGGYHQTVPSYAGLNYVFTPIIEGRCPYSKTAVVLIDAPREGDTEQEKIHLELKKAFSGSGISDHLCRLSAASLEEYMPESLYESVGIINKAEEIDRIAAIADKSKRNKAKCDLAKKIADKMTIDDVDLLPEVKNAVELARRVSL